MFWRPQLATAMAKGSASTAMYSEPQLATRQAEQVGLAWLSMHAPDWHDSPAAQANVEPHPPQLLLSVCSSTHAPLQRAKPVLHVKVHLLEAHADAAFAMEHALPQWPQLDTLLVMSTHEPLQSVWLAGQPDTQFEFEQSGVLPLHAFPHPPQLFLSVAVLTHAPAQLVEGAAHPASQARGPPVHVVASTEASCPASLGSSASNGSDASDSSGAEPMASASGDASLPGGGRRSPLASAAPAPVLYASNPETVAHAPIRRVANAESIRECVAAPSDDSGGPQRWPASIVASLRSLVGRCA